MTVKNLFPAILALGLLMVPAIASAQASKEGVDLRVAVNYSHVFYDQNVKMKGNVTPVMRNWWEDNSVSLKGVSGTVSIGYKWHYAGIYLDQDLGGVYSSLDHLRNGWSLDQEKWHFIGGTYIVARVSPVVSDIFEMDFGFGAGIMYTNGDFTQDDYILAIVPMIMDDEGESSIAFSLKASASFTVYFTDVFGMGLDFDYTIGFNRAEIEASDTYKVYVRNYIHYLRPGLHFRFRF
jgi:hypothetical protein